MYGMLYGRAKTTSRAKSGDVIVCAADADTRDIVWTVWANGEKWQWRNFGLKSGGPSKISDLMYL